MNKKELLFISLAVLFISVASASEKQTKDNLNINSFEFKITNDNFQKKHPKRMLIKAKIEHHRTHTLNPKRKHWNKALTRTNSKKHSVINNCPKRRNLIRTLSNENKATGKGTSIFIKRKRNHS